MQGEKKTERTYVIKKRNREKKKEISAEKRVGDFSGLQFRSRSR